MGESKFMVRLHIDRVVYQWSLPYPREFASWTTNVAIVASTFGKRRVRRTTTTATTPIDVFILATRVFPDDQYFCALLYFTGSDQLNRQMRIVAQEQGYKLNEYTIEKVGSTGALSKPLRVTCEQDIFDYLQMPYKQPNERNI
jgi:DNA polymerase/3'-5' exonuclease PolX